MSFTPEQRAELERMVRSRVQDACTDGRICPNRSKIEAHESKMRQIDFTAIQVQFTEGKGRFARLEEKLEELRKYNGDSHNEMRERIADAHEKIDKQEDSIEWVRGIRRAWSKIFIALIITGILAIASGALKVAVYLKGISPAVGGQ